MKTHHHHQAVQATCATPCHTGQAINSNPEPSAELPCAIYHCGADVRKLNAAISILQDRLHPVLKPESTAGGQTCGPLPTPPYAPLTLAVGEIRDDLQIAYDRVNYLIENITI